MKYFILMADIIQSREYKPTNLMQNFKKICDNINKKYKESFLSPITITLGDEFQSIVGSLKDGIEIIINFEEEIIYSKKYFKLRYVLNYGDIDTQINPDKAYEMLGPGLTDARNMLEVEKHKDKRFIIDVKNSKLTLQLNLAFFLFQSIVDKWKYKDYKTISAFLKHNDYKKVAKVIKKDVSSAWRREKSLKIDEYSAAKKLLYSLSD